VPSEAHGNTGKSSFQITLLGLVTKAMLFGPGR
jgi:hypothetical protein